jgi:hypothetical protein
MHRVEHEWRLAAANFGVYVFICLLTFAIGGVDASILAA